MEDDQGEAAKGDELDMREFSLTTGLISNLLIRLLQQNDNSENAFDDSFYISKILASLGKLDHFECMPEIATEVERKFNLDNIGQYSPQYCISKGAIKCFFNIRKQIFRFKQFKKPYLDLQKSLQETTAFEEKIQ